MKTLKLYWSSSKPNFGDALSPLICERLAGCPVVYAEKRQCDLVAVGSLLHRFKERFFHRRIHVWGTGFVRELPPRASRFHYHALRGRHSARLIEGLQLNCFGDPGLLVDRLWPELKRVAKRHRLGLVPHYEDRDDPKVSALALALDSCAVIDVFDDAIDVLHQIAACECVLSSSLHGLVVADALGIPNAWLKFSDKVRGHNFKFRDYYSLFGLDDTATFLTPEAIDPGAVRRIMDEYARPNLDRIKENLIAAFPFRP